MRAPAFALFATLAALAACAEAPFADFDPEPAISKPVNSVQKNGTVGICYGDGALFSEVEAAAAEACGDYGYYARLLYIQRHQCRVSAPHRADFACYHPEMTDKAGRLINPSDSRAVAEWQGRTGKLKPTPQAARPTAPAVPASLSAGAPAGNKTASGPAAAATAVPSASPPSARPLRPDDLAGKPAFDAAPLPVDVQSSAQPQATTGGGFSLPMEGWDKFFEK